MKNLEGIKNFVRGNIFLAELFVPIVFACIYAVILKSCFVFEDDSLALRTATHSVCLEMFTLVRIL